MRRRKRNENVKINKKVLLIGMVLILLCLILGIIFINKRNDEKNLVYDNFEPVITKINDDSYYMFGVNKDISFKIEKEDNFSYQLVDSNDKEVDVTVKEEEDNNVTITAPVSLYNEGEEYRLKINNGKFIDDDFGDTKEVIFSVKRAASQTYKLKENVKSVNNKDISIDRDIIKINDNYKENDIIVLYDKKNISMIYKIIKVEDNQEYKVTIPKLDEVFDEFDYYGMEKIDLSNFLINDDIKAYLTGMIKRKIYDSLIDTVYADNNVIIEGPTWNKAEGKLEYSVKIESDKESKIFDNDFLKYHKTKLDFTVSISALLYRNINFDNYDMALIINMDINSNIDLINTNDNFNELVKAINDNDKEYDTDWLLNDYDGVNHDKASFDKTIGEVLVATKIPGLYIKINTGLLVNIDSNANTKANYNQKIRLVGGISKNIGIYGDYYADNNGNTSALGNSAIDISNITNMNIMFMNNDILKLYISFGFNNNSKIEIKSIDGNEKEKIISVDNKVEEGVSGKFNIYSSNSDEDVSKTIFDKRDVVDNDEVHLEFIKKIKEEEIDIKKYTASEIREMIKNSFNELNNVIDKSGDAVTLEYYVDKEIDVDNNTITGIGVYDEKIRYTCIYNYLDETMKCNNFENVQSYVKNKCDNLYNQYLIFEETGECDDENAEEWEFLYGSLDDCYYETIDKKEPTNYKEDFDKILTNANLSYDDLNVLKEG